GSSSAGGFDAFVLKLNRFTGEEFWHSQFGSNGNDLARSVVVDATGVYVSGDANGLLNVPGASAAGGTDAFLRKFDQSGASLWITQYGTNLNDNTGAIAIDGTSVYVPLSTTGALPGQGSAGASDLAVKKFDLSGS